MQVVIEVYKNNLPGKIAQHKNYMHGIKQVISQYKINFPTIDVDLHSLVQDLTNKISESYRVFIYYKEKNLIKFFSSDNTKEKTQVSGNIIQWDFNWQQQNGWVIEKTFLPGVKDTLSDIVREIASTKSNNNKISVETAKLFIGFGKVPDLNSFYNPLIEKISFEYISQKKILFTESDTDERNWLKPTTKKLNLSEIHQVNKNNSLNLNNEQIHAIEEYWKKEGRPYIFDIELETIAQTWSEHCKHNIFSWPIDDVQKGIFKTYIAGATEHIMRNNKDNICVSVFTDNAGAIEFDDNHLICVKVETHNSPSALEPFGGAITGILGVNRDIMGFGIGAKPVANYYAFCFDDFETENLNLYRDQNLLVPKLSAKEIMQGVVKGVNVGGNCSGIPTPQGFLYFSSAFCAKPLVFVGSAGIIPKTVAGKPSYIKEAKDGDLIVILGGRTGRDGIHGATFSSSAITSENVKGTEVQIGDPFTQKKLSDAVIKQARDLGLYNAITDNGAGGFSSSIGEMGKNGFIVQLENAPLRGQNLSPWEIWISESQERMTLAVSQQNLAKFNEIMQKHDVECAVIGTFNSSGRAVVTFNGEEILNLDTNFLHSGNPKVYMQTVEPKSFETLPEPSFKTLKEALSDKNICTREFLAKQYDHEVQGSSVLKPLHGIGKVFADASVIKPVLSSERCFAQSQDLAIILSDPYKEAAAAIEQAIRNIITVGANPKKIALLDNFCWSDSEDTQRLWQLKHAAMACHDYSIKFMAPFISGKDSMFNDFKGYNQNGEKVHIRNFPALLITAVGIVDSEEDVISLDGKFAGDLIYIIGSKNNIDGAEELYSAYYIAIKKGIISSAIAVGNGGRAVAIAKKAIAGNLGVCVLLNQTGMLERKPEIIISVAPENKKILEEIFKDCCCIYAGNLTEEEDFVLNGIKLETMQNLSDAYKLEL